MKAIVERLKELSKKNKAPIEKARKIAENMLKTAQAAKKEAQKK